MTFNFGPVARTAAAGQNDTINLASLPLHVMLNALVGSTSAEEFTSWLWHDLYKPAFLWTKNNDKLSWNHIPGHGAFEGQEDRFATVTYTDKGLVMTHHFRWKDSSGSWYKRFKLLEPDFISDQGDQVNLGKKVNYLQLSVLSEPAMATALVRAIIAESFVEAVTKDVAQALKKAFMKDGRVPIERVRFEFESRSGIGFSSNPSDAEIWDKVGQHFDVTPGKSFVLKHLTPVADKQNEAFTTTFTADLTGSPITPSEMLENVFSLAELLTVYQDSRTVIVAVPQTQLYTIDEADIKAKTEQLTRKKLDGLGVLYVEGGFDYLEDAFSSQIETREVPFEYNSKGNRPIQNVILCPSISLEDKRKDSKHKICRLTGTPFVSNAPEPKKRLDQIFSSTFTDTEFVGSEESVAPLSYLYVLNSYKKSRAFRGAFALLAPASHFALDENTVASVERPALDLGGRFANAFSRVTVTTQEFTLFQQISRRVIAKIWHETAPDEPLPLPYLGAVFITDEQRLERDENQAKSKGEPPQLVKAFVPKLRNLLENITLLAYPFKLRVGPAVELALEVRVSNSARHYTMHTLLKTKPQITSIGSRAQLYMQLEDKEQVMLNEVFFERLETLQKATNSLKRFKKKGKGMVYQKDTWLKLALSGDDPVTAALESEKALIDTKKLPKDLPLEAAAFSGAERFWDEQLKSDSLSETWDNYQNLKQETSTTLEHYPYIERVFRLFQSIETANEEE